MSIWPASRECERCFKTYVVIFIYIFRCSGSHHCFNVAAWKLCWKKKRFSRGVLANTVRFSRFFILETLRFFAPDGITELLVLKKVYEEFTLVLNMLMCFSKSRFICFSPKVCFIKTRWSKMHNQMCHAHMLISHRAEIPCLDVQEDFMNIVTYCLLTYVYIFPKCFWDTNTVEA